MERVSVVFRVKTKGVVVQLQPPPDKDYWQEKFTSLLRPFGDEGNAFRCCLCGTLAEVSNHLWAHQTLYMLLQVAGTADGAGAGERHVAMPLSELLDASADLSSGRYSSDVVLEEEALDGSGEITVGINLETVRDHAGTPPGALRPSQPEAFILELDATAATSALAHRAGREAAARTSGWRALRLRFGGVEQPLQESSRCTLVLVSTWTEVPRALLELDVCVQVPMAGSAVDYKEIRLQMYELIEKVEAPGGTEAVSAKVKSDEGLPDTGEHVEFEATVRAVRWAGPGRPVEPARSKDTDLWCEGLATDFRTWRISVEIRSLRLTASTGNVFVAYCYEPFQQPRPFRTNPPTLARKNNTVYLPHAFAAYTLTATHEEVRAQLEEPMRIEVWNRDIYRKDDLIGLVDAGLATVFDRPLQYSKTMPSMVRGFRVLDQVCLVIGTVEPSAPRIGALRVLLFLEDLGPAAVVAATMTPGRLPDEAPVKANSDHAVHATASNASIPKAESAAGAERRPSNPEDGAQPKLSELAGEAPLQEGLRVLRGSAAYSTAYELELWKRAEEDKFRAYLAEQESRMREQLEEEYRQREISRASEFRQRQGQLKDVEAKARKKVQELQQREAALAAEENRVSILRDELKRRTDRAIEDFQDASKRQVAEAQQNLHLEHSRCQHLEHRIAELEGELASARQRAREVEVECDERRRRLEEVPAAQLQNELQVARVELEDMKRRAEALAASRDYFRHKVEELCKRMLRGEVADAGDGLQQAGHAQERQAHVAPSVHTAAQEMPEVSNALKRIQEDLAQLAKDWSSSPPPGQHMSPLPTPPAATPGTATARTTPGTATATPPLGAAQQQSHLEWLRAQREDLLESGLYSEGDPVLMALDERITEATARLH